MKTKKIILLALILIALIMSCSEQPYWEIPKDANGNAIITQVSKTTSAGITMLDGSFIVTATLPNAIAGETMTATLVKPQVPSWDPGGATQILPIAGTEKTFTVAGDLTGTVTYTRAEATLAAVSDWCTCVLSGATESGIIRIDLTSAMSISKPKVGGKDVVIIRTAEVANMEVKVTPKIAAYTADLVAKVKNGKNGTWVTTNVASPQPYKIPVAGTDFVTSDTMFWSFTATVGSLSETVTNSIVVIEPYFWLHKKGITTKKDKGRNLLDNTEVAEDATTAVIAAVVSPGPNGAIMLQAGSMYPGTIEFVPTTIAKYTDNKSEVAKADFAAGTPASMVDPIEGVGTYVFKIVNGADTFYGMLMVTAVIPNVSISYEYKIGDMYAHLAVIK